jgi:hypothetical protein
MKLPPGLSARDFDAAVKRLQSVVGPEWVFTSDEDTHLYRDATRRSTVKKGIHSVGRHRPKFRGAGAGDRQDRKRVQDSVVAISTGRNLGYGGGDCKSSRTRLKPAGFETTCEPLKIRHYGQATPVCRARGDIMP